MMDFIALTNKLFDFLKKKEKSQMLTLLTCFLTHIKVNRKNYLIIKEKGKISNAHTVF